MANIIIKSEERRGRENHVMNTFGKNSATAGSEQRDAAECIAARSREAYSELKKMENKKYY